MTAITTFLASALTLWLGAWMIERGRKRVSPLGALIGWLLLLRAVGFQAQDCWAGAKSRLDRWSSNVERARREA